MGKLELEFGTLAELEDFWSRIPAQPHLAWGKRLRNVIIDGTPTWQVYRTVPVETGNGDLVVIADEKDVNKYSVEDSVPTTREVTQSGLAIVSSEEETQTVLDWKGDPMKINKGDRMPFKFM